MAAIAVVMACGIAVFVTMRSMTGYLGNAQRDYYESKRFADVFAHAVRVPGPVAHAIAEIPGVAAVSTRVVVDVTLDVPGLDEPATARIVSVPEEHRPMLNDLYLTAGRWIEPRARDEVMVSQAFAEANGLVPGDVFDAVMNGRWQRLRLVGIALSPEFVYEIRGGGEIFPDSRRFGAMWMSEDTLATTFRMKDAFNDVALALAPGASEDEVIGRLDRLLARWGGAGAYGREDQVSHRFLSDEIDQTRITSVMIPVIFLGVTAFLLNMVLARLVATQRDQIAVLKAFGYSPTVIATHYLGLASLPVGLGAVAGSALGLRLAAGLARLYAKFYRFPEARFVPDPWVLAVATLIAAGAAGVGAFGAVRRAAAMPPAEAMRPEAPTRFSRGMLERIGLLDLLSPAARMIARSIERRPVKAMLTTLGIAGATAIVVVGGYMYDAIDFMRTVQFQAVAREDVTVGFQDPRSASARYELDRMPGVRRVEPFRAVAVRLRNGWRSHRTALIGLQRLPELHRIVDDRLAVHPPPGGDGLLLTSILADELGVRAGDSLVVDVLEGRRASRTVAVDGLVDEVVGTAAYMRLAAVSEMLGEDDALSGAYLSVDPLAAPALYRRLKSLPAVAGVGVRAAVLDAFDTTIAESFDISLGIILTFGCLIAAGVVYNGARIALSERGRELASLRVLGFSRAEVARMLLGEQALLMAVGIPLGLALGFAMSAMLAYRTRNLLVRFPLVVSARTDAAAAAVVVIAAVASAIVVWLRIRRLDLVAVLKTRE